MTLEEQLLRDEGEVLYAYPDSLGYLTIGVGHLIDKRKGGAIPQEISRLLLKQDIEKATHNLLTALPWAANLDPARFGALVHMAFNMGIGDDHHGLMSFKTSLTLIRAGRYDLAGQALRKSKWYTQVGSRAERVIQQIETGEWV